MAKQRHANTSASATLLKPAPQLAFFTAAMLHQSVKRDEVQ